MKTNNLWGDLTNISAKKASLVPWQSILHKLQSHKHSGLNIDYEPSVHELCVSQSSVALRVASILPIDTATTLFTTFKWAEHLCAKITYQVRMRCLLYEYVEVIPALHWAIEVNHCTPGLCHEGELLSVIPLCNAVQQLLHTSCFQQRTFSCTSLEQHCSCSLFKVTRMLIARSGAWNPRSNCCTAVCSRLIDTQFSW